MYVVNINALINLIPTVAEEYTVAGFYAPGDGGGGTFVWTPSPTPTPSEDGGIVFYLNGNSSGSLGYFKRLYSGPINVRWFGAKGDGVTDDTVSVHKARNSEFCKDGGTLYFPKGTYSGAFEFYKIHEQINITGDGDGSVLQAITVSGINNPVLRLGWRAYFIPYAKISNIAIDGNNRLSDGIEFTDPDTAMNAGRWIFERVTVRNCNRGVYKPQGNIGNTFSDCMIISSNYGYYAIGLPAMHAGCDMFLRGLIGSNDIAAIYVEGGAGNTDYGQLIVDGTNIEGNPGFGIFLKLNDNSNNRMTVCAVELRNVWTEGNATNSSVYIDGIQAIGYCFIDVRSVMITGGMLRNDIHAAASSVMLVNCRVDEIVAVIDDKASITADGLRYCGTPSENIFVNSISYDGTGDIANDYKIPTSVWGPLRVITQTGNKNILISQRYKEGSFRFDNILTPDTDVYSSTVYGGILKDSCAKLSCPLGMGYPELADMDNVTYLDDDADKYYIWSIHAYYCKQPGGEDIVSGRIGTQYNDPTYELGQVILKPDQWVCSYGVKKLRGNSNSPIPIYLCFSLSNGGTVLFCDYQIVKFDNFYDATSFLNSRAFAEGEDPCERFG